jgi:hypothetical protein
MISNFASIKLTVNILRIHINFYNLYSFQISFYYLELFNII